MAEGRDGERVIRYDSFKERARAAFESCERGRERGRNNNNNKGASSTWMVDDCSVLRQGTGADAEGSCSVQKVKNEFVDIAFDNDAEAKDFKPTDSFCESFEREEEEDAYDRLAAPDKLNSDKRLDLSLCVQELSNDGNDGETKGRKSDPSRKATTSYQRRSAPRGRTPRERFNRGGRFNRGRQSRKVPDYVKNPQNYRCYTLDDPIVVPGSVAAYEKFKPDYAKPPAKAVKQGHMGALYEVDQGSNGEEGNAQGERDKRRKRDAPCLQTGAGITFSGKSAKESTGSRKWASGGSMRIDNIEDVVEDLDNEVEVDAQAAPKAAPRKPRQLRRKRALDDA